MAQFLHMATGSGTTQDFNANLASSHTCIIGVLGHLGDASEVYTVIKTYEDRTASQLQVYVKTNTATQACVMHFRKYLIGDVNQSVTIPAGITGLFQDTVNTDSLSAGVAFNVRAGFPVLGVGLVTVTFMGVVLTGTPIEVCGCVNGGLGYQLIEGRDLGNLGEVYAKFKCNTAYTANNLRTYSNGAGDFHVRSRKNGAYGNLDVHVTGVGEFEDTVNSDSLVAGDLYDTEGGGNTLTNIQLNMVGIIKPILSGYKRNTLPGNTYYPTVGGSLPPNFPEADSQTAASTTMLWNYLGVLVTKSASVADATVKLRKNGGYGNLNVTLLHGVTGYYEDPSNKDVLVPTDLVDSEWDVPNVGGTNCEITYIAYGEGPLFGGGSSVSGLLILLG